MNRKSVIILSCLLLSACGGKTLSFKNSDEVIKSYKAVTKNLSEAERLEFRRNMFLVAWTSGKSEQDITVLDVKTAWGLERNTVDLTGPDAASLAKKLALQGVSKLDGKTVAEVNKLGKNLSNIAIDAKINDLKEQIKSVDLAIEQLETDKQTLKERNTEAAAEASLVKDTKIYEPTLKEVAVNNKRRRVSLTGKISLANPHADPINAFRNKFTVEHNGHTAVYRYVNGRFNVYYKEFPISIHLTPRTFINKAGESLPKDYDFPDDLSAYNYTFRPTRVRTNGPNEGFKVHEYELGEEHASLLYNLPASLKVCDKVIESTQKARETLDAQIKHLENKEIDDVRNIGVRYKTSCI